MDRGIIYPGAVPLETDLLFAQKASMVGLAKLAAAILGTATMVNGFATTQTTVPSLAVSVAAGEIYQLANIDGTAYSSIAADTTHQILKQGVALDATTLAITPPGTVGFSINYLIEATFAEVDGTPVVLPYYNASNPSTAYSGPANAGTTNNTRRAGTVVLTAKAGTAATTGSQTTPAPDANNVGLYVVTVANGAASVLNANISPYSGSPVIPTIFTGGRYQSIQVFTSSGSFTVPAGVTKLRVRVVGGGGSGGGSTASLAGAGGGSGAYAEGVVTVTPGQVITVTVGAGGAGNSGASGSIGGTSSFGAFASATGGSGGATNGGGSAPGGAPGSASGSGFILIAGANGQDGYANTGSGMGANSVFGGAGRAGGGGGVGGTAPGAGGGGAYTLVTAVGGAGAAGIVIVEY
jgi:hypothetical protein